MSAILINSATSDFSKRGIKEKPKKIKNKEKDVEKLKVKEKDVQKVKVVKERDVEKNSNRDKEIVTEAVEESPGEEKNDEDAREERKATGRSVAIVIFLSLMCLALYHVVQRKTTILAGVLVPALILFTYTFFVIHVSSRDKKRRKQLESSNDLELSVHSETLQKSGKQELQKKISAVSGASLSSIASTSGVSVTSSRNIGKHPLPRTASQVKMDLKGAKVQIDPKGSTTKKTPQPPPPPPFKKAQSQSHIQVKSNNQSAHISIEHETKNLKKSRSFDKNNYLVEPRHVIDNKKIKTKH